MLFSLVVQTWVLLQQFPVLAQCELHVGEVEQQNTRANHRHQVTAYYLKSNGLFVNQRVH